MANGLWYPANLVERELAWALSSAAFDRFFQIFTGARLFVPVRGTSGERSERWDPLTREVLGETVVPVFTSDEGLLAVMGRGREPLEMYITEYGHLRATWPDPSWRLAINAGRPIEAYLPIERLEAAAGDGQVARSDPSILIQPLDEHSWTPWPPDGPERELLEWASIGDGAEYLAALLDCMVYVPTTRPVTEAEVSQHYLRGVRAGGQPAGGDFPWRTVDTPHGRVVEAFTNQELLGQAYPGTPFLRTIFNSLFRMLPAGCGLSVNPGGPGGLDLTGEQVPLLAQWRTLEPVPAPVLSGMRWARERLERDGLL